MENEGMKKSTLIIIGVIAVIVIAILFLFVFRKDEPVEYYITTSGTKVENTLIEDYKTFAKMLKNNGINDEIKNKITFKKVSLEETFKQDLFNNKKLALVCVYEDTSKDYTYSIDSVTYNEDKTVATVNYTYMIGTFADVLSNTWYNYMFVELENSVEKVEFVRYRGEGQ